MSRRAKIGLVVGVLLVVYLAVGLFHVAVVSHLMYVRLGLEAEGVGRPELVWFHVKEVWPLVAWPVDAFKLYVLKIG